MTYHFELSFFKRSQQNFGAKILRKMSWEEALEITFWGMIFLNSLKTFVKLTSFCKLFSRKNCFWIFKFIWYRSIEENYQKFDKKSGFFRIDFELELANLHTIFHYNQNSFIWTSNFDEPRRTSFVKRHHAWKKVWFFSQEIRR